MSTLLIIDNFLTPLFESRLVRAQATAWKLPYCSCYRVYIRSSECIVDLVGSEMHVFNDVLHQLRMSHENPVPS